MGRLRVEKGGGLRAANGEGQVWEKREVQGWEIGDDPWQEKGGGSRLKNGEGWEKEGGLRVRKGEG